MFTIFAIFVILRSIIHTYIRKYFKSLYPWKRRNFHRRIPCKLHEIVFEFVREHHRSHCSTNEKVNGCRASKYPTLSRKGKLLHAKFPTMRTYTQYDSRKHIVSRNINECDCAQSFFLSSFPFFLFTEILFFKLKIKKSIEFKVSINFRFFVFRF